MDGAAWSPKGGTLELVAAIGRPQALRLLGRLAGGRVPVSEMVAPPYAEVIHHIGRCSAAAFLRNGTAEGLAYWPRSWAARSLAHLGDDGAAPYLVDALADPHWRVRMAAARALGRLLAEGYEEELSALLGDAHPRVRAAAAMALGRTGSEFAVAPLRHALDDADGSVRRAADRALAQVERRLEPRARRRAVQRRS